MVWVSDGTGARSFIHAQHARALTGPLDSEELPLRTTLRNGRQVTILVNYRAGAVFLNDPRFSRAAATGHPPVGPASVVSVTELDPPRHTFVRSLLNRMFSFRTVAPLGPQIRQRAVALIEDIKRAGPPADLVKSFCTPFSLAVHFDLLGIPEHMRNPIQQLMIERSGRPGLGATEIYEAEVALHLEVTKILDFVRERGGAGIFAKLLTMQENGLIAKTELAGIASTLLFDGPILASAQMSNAVLSLLTAPDQARLLASNLSFMNNAIEELLRWCPSITLGMPRLACTSVDLDGISISNGELAVVAFGAANRDSVQFQRPDVLDISRHPNRHLSFGRGIHHCLGAHLVRLELEMSLSTIFDMFPDISLACDEKEVRWTASHSVRRLPRLPVQWKP